MRRDTAESLRLLLTRQHDVVSTAQLTSRGVDHRLPRRERWTALAPAVWLARPGATPDDAQLLVAAHLVTGRAGVVSGALVCRLLGLRDVPDHRPADVLVPQGHR